jgi:hypothetical protein
MNYEKVIGRLVTICIERRSSSSEGPIEVSFRVNLCNLGTLLQCRSVVPLDIQIVGGALRREASAAGEPQT